MKPTHIKELQSEGRKLHAKKVGKHIFIVESGTDRDVWYTVTVTFDQDEHVYTHCNCPWGEHQGVACSHAIAALQQLAATKGRKLSFWLNEADAQRQKQRRFYLARRRSDPNGVWITSRTG